MKYDVHVIMEVSSVVTVEAESPDEAMELAYDSPDMPGSITVGAFGSASVDDGDWNVYQVTDEDGIVVWQEES